MTNKYSIASKARWASRPKELRTYMMTHAARSKWSAMTPEARKAHSDMMIQAKRDAKAKRLADQSNG